MAVIFDEHFWPSTVVTLLFLVYFHINCKRLLVQKTTALESRIL
jgi:hypothetical protein